MSAYPLNSSAVGTHIGLTAPQNKIPKGYQMGQVTQFTPEQINLFRSLFGKVSPGSYLERLASGSDEGFAPHEDYSKRLFQEYMGGLGSRYAGRGTGGMQSSAFQQSGSQAAQDFASKLAMQRKEFQGEALRDLFELSGMLMGQRPFENFLVQKQQKPSFWKQLAGGSLQGGLGALGQWLSGGL